MKLAKAFVLGAMVSLAPAALASDAQFTPGDYIDSYPMLYPGMPAVQPKFQVRQQGSRIRFIDVEKQIVYNLDLKNSGEQFLPRKFIEAIRNNPQLGRAGDVLEKVSVSGIRPSNLPNEFRAHFNLHLLLKSALGEARMTIQFEALAGADKENVPQYGNNGQQTSVEIAKIYAELRTARVTSFTSPLPDSANVFVASVLSNLTEKLSSMDSPKAELYETK